MNGRERLVRMLGECAVQVVVRGEPRGSGTLVAPGVVLTCAHVVADATEMSVRRLGDLHPATLRAATAMPHPDLALLSIDQTSHPCALLDGRYAPGDDFYAWGFTREGGVVARDSLQSMLGRIEGWAWNEAAAAEEIIKLQGAQIIPGSSGCAVLNLTTGGVCGVLSETRGERNDLGGYAIPVRTALATWTDELTIPHNAYHRRHHAWYGAGGAGPAADAHANELARINAVLEALSARIGASLPATAQQEALAQQRKQWSHLDGLTFSLLTGDTPERRSASLSFIFQHIAAGMKAHLASGRFDSCTALARRDVVTAGGGPVHVLKIFTHRPELFRSGFRAYRDAVAAYLQLPSEESRFAERRQGLLELDHRLQQKLEGWDLQIGPVNFESLVPLRCTIDGAAQCVGFQAIEPSTNFLDYAERVSTTSEALAFVSSILQGGPILVLDNIDAGNLAAAKLWAHVLDERRIDLGRVMYNVNRPEEWDYLYDLETAGT